MHPPKVSMCFKQRKPTVLKSHWDVEIHLFLKMKGDSSSAMEETEITT